MFDITPAERSEHKLYHDYNSRYYSIILDFNMRNQVLRYVNFARAVWSRHRQFAFKVYNSFLWGRVWALPVLRPDLVYAQSGLNVRSSSCMPLNFIFNDTAYHIV